jgi:hypothetical protein
MEMIGPMRARRHNRAERPLECVCGPLGDAWMGRGVFCGAELLAASLAPSLATFMDQNTALCYIAGAVAVCSALDFCTLQAKIF